MKPITRRAPAAVRKELFLADLCTLRADLHSLAAISIINRRPLPRARLVCSGGSLRLHLVAPAA